MAEGLNRSGEIVHSSDEHAASRALPAAARSGRARRSTRTLTPHSHKFLAATAMLMGIAVGAIIVAVVVAVSPGHSGPSLPWSSWSPPDKGVAGEREIADEVSPFYRSTPATQLVVVTVQNVSAPSSSGGSGGGTQIALRDPNTGSLSAVGGNTAVYNLCGLGPACAVAGGTPSASRFLLLRREALELALYTLKYISNVQNVVAILPPTASVPSCTGICALPNPPKTKTADYAIVFPRQSLQRFLSQPLHYTLPEQLPPSVSEVATAPEAELVSVVTGTAMFRQQLVQSQDGSNVLVLSPAPAQ